MPKLLTDSEQQRAERVIRRIMAKSGRSITEVWLYVESVTQLPPIVWVVMVRRLRVAG